MKQDGGSESGALLHTSQGPMARLPRVPQCEGTCSLKIETACSKFVKVWSGTGPWTLHALREGDLGQ